MIGKDLHAGDFGLQIERRQAAGLYTLNEGNPAAMARLADDCRCAPAR
jgi:hypothetical protein